MHAARIDAPHGQAEQQCGADVADDGVRGELGQRGVHGEQVPILGTARWSLGGEEVEATAHREQLAAAQPLPHLVLGDPGGDQFATALHGVHADGMGWAGPPSPCHLTHRRRCAH